MATDRRKLIENSLEATRKIGRFMRIDRGRFLQEFRLHPAQVELLHFVYHHGTATVKEIAAVMSSTASAATQLIDSLVKVGYLVRQRDTNDHRVVHLKLSVKGAVKFDQFRRRHLAMMQRLLSPLSDHELATLIAIQKKMFGTLRGISPCHPKGTIIP